MVASVGNFGDSVPQPRKVIFMGTVSTDILVLEYVNDQVAPMKNWTDCCRTEMATISCAR